MSNQGFCGLSLKNLTKLYLNSDLADVSFVFKIGDNTKTVPAHKTILAASSEVFQKMFFGPMKETGDIEIVDASVGAFEEFLQFFYMNKITLTMDNMEGVGVLANKYDMFDRLQEYATSIWYNKLTVDNMCWGYQLAIIAKHDQLKQYCERQISELPNDIFESSTFLYCNRNVLKNILQLDELMCYESDTFGACLRWATFACLEDGSDDNDPEMLRKQLADCFYLIRFGTMPTDVFIQTTFSYEKMFTRDELAQILYKTPGEFKSNKFVMSPRGFPQWDNDLVLTCERSKCRNLTLIHQTESIWFSATEPLLFGAFDCGLGFDCKSKSLFIGPTFNFVFDITITEINTQTEDKIDVAPIKDIFKGMVEISHRSSTNTVLPRPIAIHPKKIYEIRFDRTVNMSPCHSFFDAWNSQYNLDGDNTIIKFHQNPANSNQHGLVSRFWFNKL